MNSAQLQDWLDRHHVHVLRMEGVLPDGVQIGRFIHRDKFAQSLPLGFSVSDSVFSTDLAGAPYEESLLGEDEASLREVWDEMLARSPMAQTFGSVLHLELVIV